MPGGLREREGALARVDANGNELPKDAYGNYITTENGYLKIIAAGSANTIAINSSNSVQQGQPREEIADRSRRGDIDLLVPAAAAGDDEVMLSECGS